MSSNGISTDPDKMSQVKDWPTPTNRKGLQRFLGFTGYYRRYVKGYSSIVAPLYRLTSGDPKRKRKGKKSLDPLPPFIWTDVCQNAVVVLKHHFTSPSILAYMYFIHSFIHSFITVLHCKRDPREARLIIMGPCTNTKLLGLYT